MQISQNSQRTSQDNISINFFHIDGTTSPPGLAPNSINSPELASLWLPFFPLGRFCTSLPLFCTLCAKRLTTSTMWAYYASHLFFSKKRWAYIYDDLLCSFSENTALISVQYICEHTLESCITKGVQHMFIIVAWASLVQLLYSRGE